MEGAVGSDGGREEGREGLDIGGGQDCAPGGWGSPDVLAVGTVVLPGKPEKSVSEYLIKKQDRKKTARQKYEITLSIIWQSSKFSSILLIV